MAWGAQNLISTQVPTVSSRYIDAKAVISLHVPKPESCCFQSREKPHGVGGLHVVVEQRVRSRELLGDRRADADEEHAANRRLRPRQM